MNLTMEQKIIEGLLFASSEPLSVEQLQKLISEEKKFFSIKEIRVFLNALVKDYVGRGIELKEVASGFRFQVREELSPWINKLFQERPQRYSQALLEVLALVAYRQPITRAEIEEIRGVSLSTNIMRTLIEREWIQIVGHKDVPGRPSLYATTKQFLDYFNLNNLSQLPELPL